VRCNFRHVTSTLLPALALAVFAACGGGEVATVSPDAATAAVLTGAGTGSQSNVPGSNVLATFVPTAAPVSILPPTSTPPPITADEELTSVLVDNLSSDEFPRTAARTLEALFRHT
jgi:hypothetical protein